MSNAVSIDPEVLISAYQRERHKAGIGDREWRLTTGQHLDLHHVVAAMRARDGVASNGAELDVWVNYLAPVMAESGPAKDLLRDVLSGFYPAPEVKNGDAATGEVDDKPAEKVWWVTVARRKFIIALCTIPRRLLGLLPRPIAWSLIAIGIAGVGLFGVSLQVQAPPPSQSRVAQSDPRPGPVVAAASDPTTSANRAYDEIWAVTLAALRDQDFMAKGLTPRRLAGVFAANDAAFGSPDALIANLLRNWPVPPDRPLDVTQAASAASLRRLTAEAATIRSGLPRVLFEDRVTRVTALPSDIASAGTPKAIYAVPWRSEWLALAAAPWLGYLAFAVATHRRRVRALTERWLALERRSIRKPRVLQGIKQTSVPLLADLPPPYVRRESLRALTRYRPMPGRRLDGPRSVNALVRREGVADPVMRRVQRAVTYLVIIQRRQPHDHERLRVRRLFENIASRGLPFFAYDYDNDPLMVKRATAASGSERAEGINGREEEVPIATLRDLYPDARLILVTDGRDLVDRINGRVRADIAKTLFFWSERVILTPVPVGDWGEVELALSRDIDAPLGRTGEEALEDLAEGFRQSRKAPAHRIALARAHLVSGAGARLDAWWEAMAARFGPARNLSRGMAISFDQRMLTTDISPSPSTVEAIREDLRRWLGVRGFLWHAACAIYPQLRYDLTMHIGRVLRFDPSPSAPPIFCDTAADRRILERMTALPWFRSGRMPEWLRRDLLSTLQRAPLERAKAVIQSLFKADHSDGRGQLAIWWPRTGALAMPPDAVMADTLLGAIDNSALIVPERRADALRQAATQTILRREIQAAIIVGLACLGLWWFAPDFSRSPLPFGAWFPLLAFISVCLATLGALLLLYRGLPSPKSPPTKEVNDGSEPDRK